MEAAKERREILKIKVEGLEESRKKVRGGQRGVSCNENVAEIIANQIVDTQV